MYNEERLKKWLEEEKTKVSARDFALLERAAGTIPSVGMSLARIIGQLT